MAVSLPTKVESDDDGKDDDDHDDGDDDDGCHSCVSGRLVFLFLPPPPPHDFRGRVRTGVSFRNTEVLGGSGPDPGG